MTSLLGIFGSPSFTPLANHMSLVLECSQVLGEFFPAIIAKDWDRAQTLYAKIHECEDKADKVKEEMRLHLPTSLLMSVERTDILDILALQDRIANKAKHLSGVVLSRKMNIPKQIEKDFMAFIEQSLKTVSCLHAITSELESLFKTNFRRKEANKIEDLIHELDSIEDQTDLLEISIRDQVFSLEESLKPINAIFLYKVIDWISDLADRSQRCSHRFLMLIAQ